MKKIAIVGAGNVGIYAAKALQYEKDMRLCAFIRRKAQSVQGFENIPTVTNFSELAEKPDGAIICLPSRNVEHAEIWLLEHGIAAADAFDIHEELPVLKEKLDCAAKKGNTAAVTGAGWDPGLDSAIRILLNAAAPKGKTYTNFGAGMSMGHTAAVKAINGVSDAVSVTLPVGFGRHRREIYVVPKHGANTAEIEQEILSDGYFSADESKVIFTDDISQIKTEEHSVLITRCGVSAGSCNQRFEYRALLNNPAATAQLLVAAIRGALKMPSGAYYFPEIPPSLLTENYESLI
jgi:diaminopimelate dehydrogenase